MLAVQREFLAVEIVLRLHALIDLSLELIDVYESLEQPRA